MHIVRAFTDAEHTSVAYELHDPVSAIRLERAGVAVGQGPRSANYPFSERGSVTDALRRSWFRGKRQFEEHQAADCDGAAKTRLEHNG